MVIYGVSFDMVGKQPIVLLKAVDTNKFLPIWIGHPEAAAILMKLQGATTPRPMTHDLLIDMLGELDVACTRVSVTELRENTFYASITLRQRPRGRDRLAPERRAGGRGALRRADLRRRGRDRRVRDRVRARGRGHRGGRGQVQGVPRRGDARGLRGRRAVGGLGRRGARATARSSIARDQRLEADAGGLGGLRQQRRVGQPGIAFASSTVSSPVALEHQVDAREAVAAEQPVDRERELLVHAAVTSGGRSAGQTNSVRPIS